MVRLKKFLGRGVGSQSSVSAVTSQPMQGYDIAALQTARNVHKTDSQYWLTKSALALVEGDWAEAEFAWKIGRAIAVRGPECGAKASSLQSFGALRRALDQMGSNASLSDRGLDAGVMEQLPQGVVAGQPLMMDKAGSFAPAGPLGAAFCSE
jgi:hypothetical protein